METGIKPHHTIKCNVIGRRRGQKGQLVVPVQNMHYLLSGGTKNRFEAIVLSPSKANPLDTQCITCSVEKFEKAFPLILYMHQKLLDNGVHFRDAFPQARAWWMDNEEEIVGHYQFAVELGTEHDAAQEYVKSIMGESKAAPTIDLAKTLPTQDMA